MKFIAEIEVEAEHAWEHIKNLLLTHPDATVTINPKGPKTIHVGGPHPLSIGSPPKPPH